MRLTVLTSGKSRVKLGLVIPFLGTPQSPSVYRKADITRRKECVQEIEPTGSGSRVVPKRLISPSIQVTLVVLDLGHPHDPIRQPITPTVYHFMEEIKCQHVLLWEQSKHSRDVSGKLLSYVYSLFSLFLSFSLPLFLVWFFCFKTG